MKKIIFWDWTGTLADESRLDKAVCRSIEENISKKENIPFHEAEKAFTDYLKKLENTWEWHNYVQHGKHFGLNWKELQERHLDKLKLLPNTEDILRFSREKEFKNILATNAVHEVVILRLAQASLISYFDEIIASDDVQALKSEGKHFRHGLKIFNGSSHLSYSVGNNPVQDIIPANRLNLRTILCEFGENLTHYHSQHISENYTEMATPDYMIHDLLEVKNII
jgi:FMN phosphatase YigB (HAD superfamily)